MQEEPKMFCGGGLKIQIFQPSKQQQQQKQLPLAPTLINQSHIQTPEISFNKNSNSIERKSKIDDEWEWRRDYGMKSNKSVIRNDGSSKLDSPSTPMKRVVIPSLNSVDYYSDDDRDNLDDEYIVHQKSGPMISAAI